MNTSNNLPQLPPPRKNPGRWLYAAWLGVSILPLLIQPASATTIWEKATEIMKDVYQQILLISTIAAIVTASVALLMMNFSRSGRTVEESRAWLKRIAITWAILNGLGFIMAYLVKTPRKQPIKKEPISLDRFFLVKGTWAGISLLLLSIPYGMTTTYVAMYADEIGISVNSGLYFTFMAIGLAVSRMFSGRQVDKGRITLVISLGMYLAAASFFGLAALERLMQWNSAFTSYLYIGIALSQGVAFGTMFPAFNTLFVNLAPNSQRGTATSTYLTSWDVGIGIGLMIGGSIAQAFGGFNYAYLFGACLTIFSTLFFLLKAGPHFNRNKLR